MAYKLFVTIPNVDYPDNNLELGKQRGLAWYQFNNYWFGEDKDGGMIGWYDLPEFLKQFEETNNDESKEYVLYNIHRFKEMIQFAMLYSYSLYFESY